MQKSIACGDTEPTGKEQGYKQVGAARPIRIRNSWTNGVTAITIRSRGMLYEYQGAEFDTTCGIHIMLLHG
jgi:hypothetical protein